MKFALMLHLLGAVVWIGGMFFAYFALRPSAAELLQPPQRLPLWSATLGRFFRWVWVAVVLVLGSGFYMFSLLADAARVPPYVHAMLYIGVLMALIFGYVFFSPFPALQRAVAGQNWQQAGLALNQIRIAVAVNLGLGIANIVVPTAGAMLR
jgi:uncharacterized membrane protein